MSTINTNGLNVNYPIPGNNNNSQGFRDNFASIKNNFNIASSEITDLQNKAVLKSALANTTINNDMANTLISNAAVRGFRSTTYNLGNALSGTVLVDISLGDVQYGTVAGDTQFTFCCWGPTDTQCNVQLQLDVSNANAVISLPPQVVFSDNNFGITTLENYAGSGNLTIPYGVSQLDYRLSTTDCGANITIEPYNRPRQTTQIQQRTPIPTGYLGDVVGTTCVDPGTTQLTVTNTYANDEILTSSTSSLYVDMPVVFTGVVFGGLTAGTTYYVNNIPSATNFTIATSAGGANVNLSAVSGAMKVNPVQYMYVAVQDYDSTQYIRTASATASTGNLVTLNATTSLNVNDPIIFSGDTDDINTNIFAGTIYYIKSVASGTTVTLSRSRTNGVADSTVALGTATISCAATITVGSDIWKRTALNSW